MSRTQKTDVSRAAADSPGDPLAVRVRTAQILTAAMAFGVLAFNGVAIVLRWQGLMPAPQGDPLVSWIAIAFLIGTMSTAPFLTGRTSAPLEDRLRRGDDPPADEWARAWLTARILDAALAEAAAIFLIVSYLIDGWPLTLGLAVLALAPALLSFPTRSSAEGWIADRKRRVEDERRQLHTGGRP
jgi:hypothetical protein